jgi:hypothetical protein
LIFLDNTKLEIAKLTRLHWNDDRSKDLMIIAQACLKWNKFAAFIGMPNIEALQNQHQNIERRFEAVLHYWIKKGGRDEYPATWLGLRTALIDSEMCVLAKEIRDALQYVKL